MQESERVNAYIDGFSVYYGFRSKEWRRYLWLDYRAVVERLVRAPQELGDVKYFTSRVRKPLESQRRQSTYLDAVTAWGGVEIVEGKYDDRPHRTQVSSPAKALANLRLRRSWLNQGQLPDSVVDDDGRAYERPTSWA